MSMITSSERTDDVVLPNLLPSPLSPEREVVIMIHPSLISRPTLPGLPVDVGVDAFTPRGYQKEGSGSGDNVVHTTRRRYRLPVNPE